MNTLFIHSLITHNYDALILHLAVVAICWIIVIFAIATDLVAGVHKARQRKELRTSQGFKRTINKFIIYFAALMLAFLADCLFIFLIESFYSFVPAIPYLTILSSLYIIIAVEGRSVLEKASDKGKKQLSKDTLVALELISKIKDKQVFDKLIELAKNENKDDTF